MDPFTWYFQRNC